MRCWLAERATHQGQSAGGGPGKALANPPRTARVLDVDVAERALDSPFCVYN